MIRRFITRTEPADVIALTTLAQLKTELGDTTDTNDAKYTSVINYCSNEISAYLNTNADEVGDVTIGRETLSETVYGVCGLTDIILSRMPVGEIVSVTESGVTVPRLIDDEANPAFTYVVKNASGVMWKLSDTGPSYFTSDAVTVVYSAGWILPGEEGRTLPFTIEDACLRFCRVKLDQVSEGSDLSGPLTGAKIEGVGDFQFGSQAAYNTGRGLPYEVRNLLERYKTPTYA